MEREAGAASVAGALRCPECGARTVSVAAGYDPFAQVGWGPPMRMAAMVLDCPAGHRWIEGYGPGRRQAG